MAILLNQAHNPFQSMGTSALAENPFATGTPFSFASPSLVKSVLTTNTLKEQITKLPATEIPKKDIKDSEPKEGLLEEKILSEKQPITPSVAADLMGASAGIEFMLNIGIKLAEGLSWAVEGVAKVAGIPLESDEVLYGSSQVGFGLGNLVDNLTQESACPI